MPLCVLKYYQQTTQANRHKPMNTHKHTERDSATIKLVKTDSQTESAFLMFSCIIVASILLIVTIIAEHL